MLADMQEALEIVQGIRKRAVFTLRSAQQKGKFTGTNEDRIFWLKQLSLSQPMLLDVELAKSAAYCAAQACAIDDPEWPALASLAKASASETYLRTAAECIQIHGGIGFTWDNDTHLWFKRAKSSEVFLGQPSYHRELLMQRWGV